MGSAVAAVTFNDKNNFLVQVMTGEEVGNHHVTLQLSDKELEARGRQRKEIQLKCPGEVALHFKMLLNTHHGGGIRRMGHVESFCNKKTSFCVHARPFALQLKNKGEKLCVGMAIWMKGHKELSKEANVLQQKDAETVVKEFFECIASAELFSEVGNHTLHTLKTATDHDCSPFMFKCCGQAGSGGLRRTGAKESLSQTWTHT